MHRHALRKHVGRLTLAASSPDYLEQEASKILPATAGRFGGHKERLGDEYDILSAGPFCHQLISHEYSRAPTKLGSLRRLDRNEAEIVTLKQLKGWRRVLVLQRFKKGPTSHISRTQYPSSTDEIGAIPVKTVKFEHVAGGDHHVCSGAATARSGGDHSRWGRTPVRLRFSTPHWESKTAVEQARMGSPRQLTNLPMPARLVALTTRSMDSPVNPTTSVCSGDYTERKALWARQHDAPAHEILERGRAEVKVLKTAMDASDRTLDAFDKTRASTSVTWPLHHRWGSLQVFPVRLNAEVCWRSTRGCASQETIRPS